MSRALWWVQMASWLFRVHLEPKDPKSIMLAPAFEAAFKMTRFVRR